MEVLVVKKLHHIYSGYQMFCLHYCVILRSSLGVDEQQSIRPQTKTREGGEERQIHFADLMLTGDKLVRCLASNRCQTLRRENDVDSNTRYQHYRQNDTQKRPAEDF